MTQSRLVSWVVHYGVATLLVLFAFAIQLSLKSTLGENDPLLVFTLAVTLAAWRTGLGPGLWATALSLLLCVYYFIPPIGLLQIEDRASGMRVLIFAFIGAAISWMCERQVRDERALAREVIERKQAQEKLRRDERNQQFLLEIAEKIRQAENASGLLFAVSQAVGEHLQVRRCLFNEIDLANDRETVHHDYCHGVESVAGIHHPSDYSSITLAEMKAGRTVVNRDSRTDPRTAEFYEQTYARNGERAYVAVPLLREGCWVSTLWVSDDRPRDWSEQEIELLETVAERAWLAVEKLRSEVALRESEARMQLAMKIADAATWDVDLVKGKTYWSDSHFTLLGYEPTPTREATAEMWQNALPPEDLERVLAEWRQAEAARDLFRSEYRIIRADNGKTLWVTAAGRFFYDAEGKAVRFTGVFYDITEAKQIAQERERILARERAAREQAEAHNRAKDEFLAVISHELRSPLNAILGYTRLARSDAHDAPQVVQYCNTIERAARTQQQLIEDLLDIARIITGKLRIDAQPCDLRLVLEEALAVVRPAAEAKEITLVPRFGPLPQPIYGDAARLQQMVWNLLQNAVKFTPAGGRVELRTEQTDRHVRVSITDNGKGIEPEFLPSVFDRFSQNDMSRTRRYGGLGLGLALVKQLIELHGGEIDAASEGAGHGATFTVTLPLGAPQIEAAPHLPPLAAEDSTDDDEFSMEDSPSLAGVHVLAVDDQEEARDLIALALARLGASVTVMASGAEALDFLAGLPPAAKPDVLLLDISMPDEDGYAVLHRVRALEAARGVPETARIPAIALTAHGGSQARLAALSAGFQMYVAKPVELAELAMVIATLVGQKKKGAQFSG